jgi:hypothetical protein
LTRLAEWRPVLLLAEHGLARLREASVSDWEEFCTGRPEARAAIRERYHLDAVDRLLSVFTVTGPAVVPEVTEVPDQVAQISMRGNALART